MYVSVISFTIGCVHKEFHACMINKVLFYSILFYSILFLGWFSAKDQFFFRRKGLNHSTKFEGVHKGIGVFCRSSSLVLVCLKASAKAFVCRPMLSSGPWVASWINSLSCWSLSFCGC